MKKMNLILTILLLSLPRISYSLFMPGAHGLDSRFLNKAELNVKFKVVVDINTQYTEKIKFEIQDSDRINAYATYTDDDYLLIVISRGLLDHKLATKNVLKLMVCHELGHFIGGEPKQMRGRSDRKSWSTAEGQADFYLTSICMKKIIKKSNSIKKDLSNVAQTLKTEINKICQNDLCKEVALASYKVAKIYADIKFWKRKLSFVKKDDRIAHQTIRKHLNPQCRLDALIAALLYQEVRDLSKSEDLFLTCTNEAYKQPSCWLSPSLYQGI